MSIKDAARRDFLRFTGFEVSGAAVGSFARPAFADAVAPSSYTFDVRAFGARSV